MVSRRSSSSCVKPSSPSFSRLDQRAVHDEIGVAANRRGEVRVGAQIEAEMADVVGRVDRLRLAAQHHFVDDFGVRPVLRHVEDAVEARGCDCLALGPAHVHGGEEVRQRRDLLFARTIVHAVDQRPRFGFECLRRADVGLDHEFFDELVRIEAFALLHACDLAVLEHDLVLGAVDLERIARFARPATRNDTPPRAASGSDRAGAWSCRSACRRWRLARPRRRASPRTSSARGRTCGCASCRPCRIPFRRRGRRGPRPQAASTESDESACGSIGATRSGKYVELPRLNAPRSSADFGVT